MPTPIGYVEAWLRFTIVGDPEPMYIALGYRITTPPFTQGNANALIGEMQAAVDGPMSNTYTLDGGHVLVGNDGGDLRYDVTSSRLGATAAEALPQNCALLVGKNTGLGGRRNRGRFYLPGVPEGQVNTNGTLVAAYLTGAQTAMNLLMSNALFLASNTDAAVLFHRSPPFTPTVITSVDVKPLIATQRRRLRP